MPTSSRPLGRLSVVACVALASAVLPASVASGAPPPVDTSQVIAFPNCILAGADGATADINAFWTGAGQPFESMLTVRVEGEPIAEEVHELSTVDWNGSVLSGSFVLGGMSGADDGTATFALEMGPSGSAFRETFRTRLGNLSERQPTTNQPLEVTAGTVTVVLGERTWVFEATGCTGRATTTVTVLSQPDTYVYREPIPDILADCAATNADGDVLSLYLNGHHGSNVLMDVLSGGRSFVGFTELDWYRPPHPVAAPFEVTEIVGEEHVVIGTGRIELTTTKTGHTSSTLVYQGGRDKLLTTFFTADGTVEFPGLAPFAITDCAGFVATALDRTSTPAGPPPGGRAPVNEVREGAPELVLGAPGVNVQTGGAALQREDDFGCTAAEYPEEAQPGRTVWFRITGTGGEVTLDPSGSSFNTVLAVYEERDSGLVEVGCVDDAGFGTLNPTLQGPLTVATDEGGTYFVQVGGFAGEYGRLRLAAVGG